MGPVRLSQPRISGSDGRLGWAGSDLRVKENFGSQGEGKLQGWGLLYMLSTHMSVKSRSRCRQSPAAGRRSGCRPDPSHYVGLSAGSCGGGEGAGSDGFGGGGGFA